MPKEIRDIRLRACDACLVDAVPTGCRGVHQVSEMRRVDVGDDHRCLHVACVAPQLYLLEDPRFHHNFRWSHRAPELEMKLLCNKCTTTQLNSWRLTPRTLSSWAGRWNWHLAEGLGGTRKDSHDHTLIMIKKTTQFQYILISS
jgi:hypothetical protein